MSEIRMAFNGSNWPPDTETGMRRDVPGGSEVTLGFARRPLGIIAVFVMILATVGVVHQLS